MPARLIRCAFLAASLVFLIAGCTHVPRSAARKYAAAPKIENPLVGQAQTGVPGYTREAEAVVFGGFDGRQLCFQGHNEQSPAEATRTRYSLSILNTDEVDFRHAPTLKTSIVQVLGSESRLVPVTREVQDTVRDSRGNTVATVSRQVQELETHYQTQVQICFPGPQEVLTAEARYMVLLREAASRSMFGIPAQRSSWVWRFPASEVASPPLASR